MKRGLWIGAASLLLVWALLLLRFSGTRSTSSSFAPSPSSPRPSAAPAAPPARPSGAPRLQPAPQPEAPPKPRVMPPPMRFGDVEGFKRAYASKPRDPQAAAAEAHVETLFGTERVPRDMLLSAACRKTVCRVRVRWSQQRGLAFAALLMDAGVLIVPMAVEPNGVPDRAGNLEVDIYLLREGVRNLAQASQG